MFRFSALIGLALAAFPAAALAADPQIVAITTPAQLRATLIDSADRVCRQARAHDAFGDFGTQADCMDNTIRGAVVRPAPAPVIASRVK